MDQIAEAHSIAWVLWAAFFLVIYQHRAYYLAFCGLLALGVGASGLEYAPALWVPVEFVLGGVMFFRDIRNAALGRKSTGGIL